MSVQMDPILLKEIMREPWSFVLFKGGNRLFLSVCCGSIAIYDLNIELTLEEVSSYREMGKKYIKALAAEITYSPTTFSHRHIKSILSWPKIDLNTVN